MMEKLSKSMSKLNHMMLWVAGVSLILCMSLIVFNAIIRNFTAPIAGTAEIAGILGMFGTVFALSYTQAVGGNVSVSILTDKFPPVLRKLTELAVTLLSAVFFTLVSYKLVQYGISLISEETFLQTTGITIYPFVLLMSVGFIGLCAQLVYQILMQVVALKVGESK